MKHKITGALILEFGKYLRREELSEKTIEKYMHDVRKFYGWIDGQEITKELVAEWKEHLCNSGYTAVTVNSSLAALHGFLKFAGWNECRVKYLKIQRRAFRDVSRELTKQEFRKLVNGALKHGNFRLALLMETICATGIRVSETRYITVEAARNGRAEIHLKGKIRTILLPGKLARKLLKYAKKQKITSGEIFVTASGKSLSRRQIWSEMKHLCKKTGVDHRKVFPHNLRHLFARTLYQACRDIVRLADVLGHSSIDTTRIYLITTGDEYERELDRLGFVS